MRMLKQAFNKAAGDGRTGGVAFGYVEDFDELRRKLGACFRTPFQRWYFVMRYRSVFRVILRSLLASEIFPPARSSASFKSFFSIS